MPSCATVSASLADEDYAARIARNSEEVMVYVEKQVLLQTLDHLWREHLVTLDHLRQVVGWRGYAQRDPLNEYKQEAFELFDSLIGRLREQVTGNLMRIEVRYDAQDENPPLQDGGGQGFGAEYSGSSLQYAAVEGDLAVVERDPADPSTWGKVVAQRGLPVRLRQEVQALPRPIRLSRAQTIFPPEPSS